MHDLIVAHVESMWEVVLAGEWSSASRTLQRQSQVFQQCLEPERRSHIATSCWDGKPCCFRPISPSCSAVVLYSSKRPSAASSARCRS